ncbi:MAG: S-layer homology domain-containing protein [Oscillospiraceae bacterium]|nr:S-layer homology domain-containing protein [Oscillospiraceae bacterium]
MKTKRTIAKLLALLMLFSLLPQPVFSAHHETTLADGIQLSGSGTEEDPYLIYTLAELEAFRDTINTASPIFQNSYVKLMNDIVMNGPDVFEYDEDGYISGVAAGQTPYEWTPINNNISNYGLCFDGNGHIISGMYISQWVNGGAAFFTCLWGGTLKNLGVADGYVVSPSTYTAGLIAYGYDSKIQNCFNSCTIIGETAGGIVANDALLIENCYNLGFVKGEAAGGIICLSESSGTVINCYNLGRVSGNSYVGGIAGDGGIIDNCYNSGTISGTEYIGGIAGHTNSGLVTNSYNNGLVIGSDMVGGILGYSYTCHNDSLLHFEDRDLMFAMASCYNVGHVLSSSANTGGLIGGIITYSSVYNYVDVLVEDCYFLDTTAPEAIGSISIHKGEVLVQRAESKTEDELKVQETYTGFDFESVWMMGEIGYDYPYPILISLIESYAPVGNCLTLIVTNEFDLTLTSGFTVNWYENGSDTVIGHGNVLIGYQEDSLYEYEILLGEALSYQYRQPYRADAVCTNDSDQITVRLEPLGSVEISGRVVDLDGVPLSNASVTLKQCFNGKYERDITAEVREDGTFFETISFVPTVAEISANGYYTRTKTVILGEGTESSIQLGDLTLTKLPENKITLNLYKTGATTAGQDGLRSQLQSANGISFSVYDQTRDTTITGFTVQYPYLILEDDAVSANDVLLIHAADEDGQMTAAPATVVLDEQKMGECDIEFLENGWFSVGAMSGSAPCTVMIFDENDLFVRSATAASNYQSAPLRSGSYSLVFIEKTDLLRSAVSMDKLAAFGLDAGTDYLVKYVTITNGVITDIGDLTVPDLDESRLYYTVSDSTSFTSNASAASIGKYVMMRCAYQIDDKYSAKNERVTIELPDGVLIANGSLTLDGAGLSYSLDGNLLSVFTNNRTGIIRFYAVAATVGRKEFNAYLSFRNDETDIIQPIGSAIFTAEAGKLVIPEETSRFRITATGTTLANSTITVYDNGMEVGTTRSNAVGSWGLLFDLVDPYNYSLHEVNAKIENDKIDGVIVTDTQSLLYVGDCIEVSKVTMINSTSTASSTSSEYQTVFDFLNPQNVSPYYVYNPSCPTFTFLVEFIGGTNAVIDDTIITEVYVITQNSREDNTYVPCTYDASTGLWLGTHDYTSSTDVPVKVNVHFTISLDYEDEVSLNEAMLSQEIEALYEGFLEAEVDLTTLYSVTSVSRDNETTVEVTSKDSDGPSAKYKITTLPPTQVPPEEIPEIRDQLRNEGYAEFSDPNSGSIFTRTTEDGSLDIRTVPDPPDLSTPVTTTHERIDYQIDLDPASGANIISAWDMFGGGDVVPASNALIYWLDNNTTILDNYMTTPRDFTKYFGLIGNIYGYAVNSRKYSLLHKYISRLYSDYVDLVGNSYGLLYRKCTDGGYALTPEQMTDFRSRLTDLTDEYKEKHNEIQFGLNLVHGTMTLSAGIYLALPWETHKVESMVEAYLLSKGGAFGYAGIRVDTVNLHRNMLKKLSALYNEILQAYRCPLERNPALFETPGSKMGHSSGLTATVHIDPSGYVYEAVPSNRVEGVKAEAYVYDYDYDEFGMPSETKSEIFWNAEAYDQVNPLYTDVNGMYAWDVPIGQWLVRFSKDGYYDTDSRGLPFNDEDGYLPVPPPQTEVNVGIISKATPTVAGISTFSNEIRIEFSQYMQIDTVAPDTVTVKAGGSTVSGTLIPANAEYDYEHVNQYASVFLFLPSTELSGSISVTVNGAVNYAGTAMTRSVTQFGTAEVKPEALIAADDIHVTYRSGALLEITATPEGSCKNAELEIVSYSPSIVGIANEGVTTDENGHANIMVLGLLPGQGEIAVSVKGTDLKKLVTVTISGVENTNDRCEKVTASIPSGSTVVAGTMVELTTSTEGAEIYYTLDGTCPCILESPSRILYTGPIQITADTFIIAYAVKEGLKDSYTAGFSYFQAKNYNPFEDVLEGKFYYEPVLWAYYHNPFPITSGIDDTHFGPKNTCTRGQVVRFLWNAVGQPEPTITECPFVDVKPGKYYYDAVLWALETGVTSGKDETHFAPNETCTRGQVVRFLWNAIGQPEPVSTECPFVDVKPGKYYFDAMLWALENGITSGIDASRFGPNETCTRGQVVTFLYYTFVNEE